MTSFPSSAVHMLRAIRRSFRRSKKKSTSASSRPSVGSEFSDDVIDGSVRLESAHEQQPQMSSSQSLASSTSSSLNSLMDVVDHLEVIEEVQSAEVTSERRSLVPSSPGAGSTMLAVKSRSLPERFEHAVVSTADGRLTHAIAVVADHNDSGYGVEIVGREESHETKTTHHYLHPHSRLQRQTEITSSDGSSASIFHAAAAADEDPAATRRSIQSSATLLFQRDRTRRSSFRNFRYRSEEFLRRTFRPSCIRSVADAAGDGVSAFDVGSDLSPSSNSATGAAPGRARLVATRSTRKRFLSHQLLRQTVTGSSVLETLSLTRDDDAVSATAAAMLHAAVVGTAAGASTSVSHSLRSSNSDVATLPSSFETETWADQTASAAGSRSSSGQSSPSTQSMSADQVERFRL